MVRKKLVVKITAFLAALSLIFSVLPVGGPVTEAKATELYTINTDIRNGEGNPSGLNPMHVAIFWYTFKDRIANSENYTTWEERNTQIEEYGKTTTPAMFIEKDTDKWDWDWDNESIDWNFKDNFLFDEVTVDSIYENQWGFNTKRLEVTSQGAITISGDTWAPMTVKESALVSGSITLTGTNENTFELQDNATLTFAGGRITTGYEGVLRVAATAKIYTDEQQTSPLEVNINGQNVTFNGSQGTAYDLTNPDGTWVGEEAPHIVENVVLPQDEKSFRYTLQNYYDHKQYDGEGNELPPSFTKITIDCPGKTYHLNNGIAITELVVTEGSTLAIETGENSNPPYDKWTCSLDVNKATINGIVTLSGADVGVDENNNPFVNHLVIYNELNIGENGAVRPSGNAQFELSMNDPVDISVKSLDQLSTLWGSIKIKARKKLLVNGSAYEASVGTGTVVFDGNQKKNYELRNDKSKWSVIGVADSVVLPRDKAVFEFSIDDYYSDDPESTPKKYFENGDEMPPAFDTITIENGEFELKNSVLANKLIVKQDGTLKFGTDAEKEAHEYWWEHEDKNGNKVRELIYDDNNKPVMVKNEWAGQIYVNEAEIAGSVKIDESTAEWHEYNAEKEKMESGFAVKYLEVFDKLTITGQGKIEISGNGELSFGEEPPVGKHQEITIPSTNAISTEDTTFSVNPRTIITVGEDIYTISVKSGNPDDNATHDGFKFDGEMNDVFARFASTENGDWVLQGEDGGDYEVWWGGPFKNEYRVYFGEGKVKVGGKEISTDDFISFEAGKPIEFELVPESGYTGTPIVIINGGLYNDGAVCVRSDDFLASDTWIKDVKKASLTGYTYSYTPQTSEGIGFNVYYDPEQIIEGGLFGIDRKYLWAAEKGDDNVWRMYPWAGYGKDGYNQYGLDYAWADPLNEFIIEATQNNSNGTIELTPGIDFYRLGNKVKQIYQGFEILGGNTVEVKFKPASGYDLLAVTIDGTSYSPMSVEGMTYSGGVYTLAVTETPKVVSDLKGFYGDTYGRTGVKIKTINATFGIRSYSGGGSGDSGSSSGGSGTNTEPAPSNGGNGSSSDTETEPEIKKQTTTTDKADDGTQTTTTSTTYTDGSKVTEKVIEKPDGSSTSTTTTTEADGTKIVEKVEEKADGSSKATTTTTETDGTKKTETVEKKKDGTEVTTNTVKDADGNSTTEKVEKKKDGTVTTTNTTKDADGASTTEKVVEKPDGSVTTTSTEKDADGNVLSTSKVVEKTKEDGTKTITATEKNADGSSSTSKTTISTDGSSKTNTTTQNADGSTTKEKITEKADGSLTRTATTTDEDGNVLATEKEKVTISKSGTETSTTTVENADGSSSESVVKTKADGTATSTLTETDASGNVSVTIGSTKKDGSGISKSYAVEDDGVVLTAVEATTTSASIPASVKVNGKTVPVTSVGENAMKDNETVKTVKLADSITSIGEGAFSGASNLKTIKLSANITEIAPGAFEGIKSNATFYITATSDKEFDALVELLKKSGVGSKVKFKRA